MYRLHRISALLLICLAATIGCAPTAAPSLPTSLLGTEHPAPNPPAAPRRLTIGVGVGATDLGPSNLVQGTTQLRMMVRGGLTTVDDRGARRPELAESVPTLENGLWQVLPDGRMETTWKLKPTAMWHDGTPFTTSDLLFSLAVFQDREVAQFRAEAYTWIDEASAPDAHTLLVRWSRPYIDADALFSHTMTPALPRHLLAQRLAEDKESFLQLPYWREEFVGTGPFKIRAWAEASHVLLEANDRYVLGRPKLDLLEVRFIPDQNTRVANVLTGVVDLTMGGGLSVERGMIMREQWREGQVAVEFTGNWIAAFPQLMDPRPGIVADVRFRKALMHAIDRQELADTIQHGLVPVAHSFLIPNQPQYREIEARLVRYDYDPRQAAQMIEGLGYARAADGVYRDPAGQRLELDIMTFGTDGAAAAVADSWGRLGVPTSITTVPQARRGDLELTSTFPAFCVANGMNDLRAIADLHSSRNRVPENNFRVPGFGNFSRYRNAEFDAAIDRYFTTIPPVERTAVLGQIIHHISDQLNSMGLVHTPQVELIGNRVVGITTGRAAGVQMTWNANEWDVRP